MAAFLKGALILYRKLVFLNDEYIFHRTMFFILPKMCYYSDLNSI